MCDTSPRVCTAALDLAWGMEVEGDQRAHGPDLAYGLIRCHSSNLQDQMILPTLSYITQPALICKLSKCAFSPFLQVINEDI